MLPVEGRPAGRAFSTRRPLLLSRADLEGFSSEIARRLAAEDRFYAGEPNRS